MGLFNNRPQVQNKFGVPVWFMRQAGRYHQHYQNIKKNSDFMTMCKNPDLACEITLGPIEDFKFDGAILFSDLLFPLEQLGLGLSYESGPPTLEKRLDSMDTIKQLKVVRPAEDFYLFQQTALKKLKQSLPSQISLLGFVGAPFTLYTYACEGAHKGELTNSKLGLYDGRFQAFMEKLIPELVSNMDVQAKGNPEAICLFDTAAGELCLRDYKHFVLPFLRQVTSSFKNLHPDKKIIYYSKMTHLHYLQSIEDDNIDVLGIDWRVELPAALKLLSKDYMIQGNLDPSHLHLPWPELEKSLRALWREVLDSKADCSRWIMGLGHGVLQRTPERNVRNAVKLIHQEFLY